MELQTTKGQQLTKTAFSPKQIELGKQVRRLSLAGNPSFPIPDAFIVDYIQEIEEHAPTITPAILKKIVNLMLTGKIPYDVNKGVRNIFDGLNEYIKIRKYYGLFNVNTGIAVEANEDDDFTGSDMSVWRLCYIRQHGCRKQPTKLIEDNGLMYIDPEAKNLRLSYLLSLSDPKHAQPFNEWMEVLNKNRGEYCPQLKEADLDAQ